MKHNCRGKMRWLVLAACALPVVGPGFGNAQEVLSFATRIEARNIGIGPTAPTYTGVYVPAGAEVVVRSGDGAAPFTLIASLDARPEAAAMVGHDVPLRFEGEGMLTLELDTVACGALGGWGAAVADVSVSYDRVVMAPDGDWAAAWGLPIIELSATDMMTINAEGAVSYWEGGPPIALAGEGNLSDDALVPEISINSLVGLIGDNAPFLIGSRAENRGEEGWLWVSVNDEIGKPGAFLNNSGGVNLHVDVVRSTEQTGALAEACGGTATEAVPVAESSAQGAQGMDGGSENDLPIAPGQVLVTGTQYHSANRAFHLAFLEDGQLVVRHSDGRTIWSSLDAGAPLVPSGYAMVSFGGELALFDSDRQLVWAPIGDMAVPGSVLYIASDGGLKMLSPSWTVTWPRDQQQVEAAAFVNTNTDSFQPGTTAPQQPAEVASAPAAMAPAMAETPSAQTYAETADATPAIDSPPADAGAGATSFILTTMWREGEGECLTIGQGRYGLQTGASVGMAPCSRSAEQRWIAVPLQESMVFLRNSESGQALCLTLTMASEDEAPQDWPITMEPCAEAPGQIWQILQQDNGYFRLSSPVMGSSMCLEGAAPNVEVQDGASFMYECQDVSGQFWIDGPGAD